MTAASTIEALMQQLRGGLGVLADGGARSRLASCDQRAIREVAGRLRNGGKALRKWSEADIETLLVEWKRIRGR